MITHLNARSAISWNQMAFTILERRKNGRTQSVENATERMGWVYPQTASALKQITGLERERLEA